MAGKREQVAGEGLAASAGELIAQGQAISQVRTPFMTAVAVQIPRDLARINAAVAAAGHAMGEECYYSWLINKGKKNEKIVEGIGIPGAMVIAREYGNLGVAFEPVQELERSIILPVTIVDLERGVTITRPWEHLRSKARTIGLKTDDESRRHHMAFQIDVSKGIRNVVVKYLPDIAIKMLNAAKASVRKKMDERIKKDGIERVRADQLVAFAKFDIDQERIERRWRCPMSSWDAKILTTMAGDLATLRRGEDADPDVLYPPVAATAQAEVVGSSKLSPEDAKPAAAAVKQETKPSLANEGGKKDDVDF